MTSSASRDETLSLHEAAEALGVHYMTAYRYVRLGVLPAHREGRSWRVRRVDLDTLGEETPPTQMRKPADWDRRFVRRALAGDGPGAWAVLEAAFAAPEPTSPNRAVLLLLSLVLALVVGSAMGLLLEAGDTSVHSARQLQNALRIPVLAAIPQILLESDRRTLRRKRIRTGIATAAVVAFALVGVRPATSG